MSNTCSCVGLRYTLWLLKARILKERVEKNTSEIWSFQCLQGRNILCLSFCQPLCTLWVVIFLSFRTICFWFFSTKGTIGASNVWNEMKHVARWKTKAHLLAVKYKWKKFVCCRSAYENSQGVTGLCYAQYKMRSVISGESPWKTMARKLWAGITQLEQSRTRTIGFGIFHYERNIGYGVHDFPQPSYWGSFFYFRLT